MLFLNPTGFGRFELYQKLGEGKTLEADEQEEWNRVIARFDAVCKSAHENDIALLIGWRRKLDARCCR